VHLVCWAHWLDGMRPAWWAAVCSKVQTCRWSSWCHCHSLSLASVKSRLALPCWHRRLTWVVLENRAAKWMLLLVIKCFQHSLKTFARVVNSWLTILSSLSCWPRFVTLTIWSHWPCYHADHPALCDDNAAVCSVQELLPVVITVIITATPILTSTVSWHFTASQFIMHFLFLISSTLCTFVIFCVWLFSGIKTPASHSRSST